MGGSAIHPSLDCARFAGVLTANWIRIEPASRATGPKVKDSAPPLGSACFSPQAFRGNERQNRCCHWLRSSPVLVTCFLNKRTGIYADVAPGMLRNSNLAPSKLCKSRSSLQGCLHRTLRCKCLPTVSLLHSSPCRQTRQVCTIQTQNSAMDLAE